ncbi:MAG: hypothetical protein M1831_003845 [Alyxoria varia]|nr:MAG: hypothetical protein M1831_003845 [Alyxoria varia]
MASGSSSSNATITNIQSPAQLAQTISGSKIVVADFWADWCGPCKAIAPLYEQLAHQLSRPGKITFVKVDTDAQKEIARGWNVTAMPTFLIIKNGRETSRIMGADGAKLQKAVQNLAKEADSVDQNTGESSVGASDTWLAKPVPQGYADVTNEVESKGLDLLNVDSSIGDAKTLFLGSSPSSLDKGKGKESTAPKKKDWVESDTDEQLMLFVPFMSIVKIHSLQLTSLPPKDSGDEVPMRPKTIKLYTNNAHNLGFEEADDITPTQEVVLDPGAWGEEDGTAKVDLRFVKFQKCSSVVIFVVNGDGDGDKVRLDRIRFIGDTGEKIGSRKVEKVGED